MAGAIKALTGEKGAWLLDVLGNPFGGPRAGKDSHGEYFSPRTRFHEDKFPLPPAVYYHGLSPNGQPAGTPAYIGKTLSREVRSDGVWYRVELDQAEALAERVWTAAQKQQAVASSGSAVHLTRTGPGGEILEWPVVELSLFDLDPASKRVPANSYAIARPVYKALYQHIGGHGGTMNDDEIKSLVETSVKTAMEGIGAQIKSAVSEVLTAERKATEDAEKAAAEAQAKIDAAVKAALEQRDQEDAAARRLPGGAPVVRQFADLDKFDGLDAGETAFAIALLNEGKQARLSEWGPSDAAMKALIVKLDEDKTMVGTHGRVALKAAGFSGGANAVKSLMGSTINGFGQQWVGVTWATALWEKIRIATFVMEKLRTVEIPQGAESLPIPVEGAGFTFFRVVDATTLAASGWPNATVPASRATTPPARELVAKKLGARAIYNGDLEEDAVIAYVPWLRDSLVKDGMEHLESLFLDGHTAEAANSNINLATGTPAADSYYLLWNGVRALSLAVNSANSRDAGAMFTEEDFLLTTRLMGLSGRNALDKNRVEFIIDPAVHSAALLLPAVKTRDVNSSPTIENGNLTRIWGHNVNVSGQLCRTSSTGLSSATGRVSATEADNTRGTIAAVRWDQWVMGLKRAMRLETTRIARADSTEIVATMRADIVHRDNEAAAISYNVAV